MNSYKKKKQIKRFDPNGVGQKGSLFGLPFDTQTADVVVIPVPWDVTTSFRDGASLAPRSILGVSSQIDLEMHSIEEAWKIGVSMLPIDDEWIEKNDQARKFAKEYINFLEGQEVDLSAKEIDLILKNINLLSERINEWVYSKSTELLDDGKIPVVLGGDHSSPFGLMKAISSRHNNFGVLQIDAHADLRPAYEGFKHSHASIMHNLLKLDNVIKLVQVGVRDYCQQEKQVMDTDDRIVTFYDAKLSKERFEGITWKDQVDRILRELPEKIYVSVDIDGLEQIYCPGTGTPVPGGLTYAQILYLFECIIDTGKTIISFDICEISGKNGDWDAIVGSRILYNLANIAAVTQKLPHDQ